MAKLIETNRIGAEIYFGDISNNKILEILEEFSIPKGIFPTGEIDEFGFNRKTGFTWILRKKKREHKFKKIGVTCIFNIEITSFLEKGRMSKITGIKIKELFVQIGVSEMFVGDPTPDMIKCTTSLGLYRFYPCLAFDLEDGESVKK